MPYEAVECFWVEPTGKAIRTLRRYSDAVNGACPARPGPHSYHNVSIEIGRDSEVIWNDEPSGARYVAALDVEDFGDDPRWPTHCACGYEFRVDDHWQVNQEPIYATADGREACTSPSHGGKPTPGAMFDTFWRPELRKADGLAISVVCPNGTIWCIDGEATSGGYWERHGEAPKLTVTPSIQAGDYHGFLTDGVLTAG
jgi:hypothetical protein